MTVPGLLNIGVFIARVAAPAEKFGITPAWLFCALALASFGVAWFVMTKWGREGVRDVGALIFKLLFGPEVRGIDDLPAAGTRMIIAPSHVSLMDGPLLHAVLPSIRPSGWPGRTKLAADGTGCVTFSCSPG